MGKRNIQLRIPTPDPLALIPDIQDTPFLMREMGYLSVADLCLGLGIKRLAVYRLIRRSGVQTTQVGKKVYINIEDLHKRLAEMPPRSRPRPHKTA